MRTAEQFWACVNKEGPVHPTLHTKCWLWLGAIAKARGYGRSYFKFNDGSIERLAHRAAWRLTTQAPIPAGLCVLHRCDVRLCTNPEHLFLGTALENTEDMRVKGRAAKGERNSQLKLSESVVRAILIKAAEGKSIASIAREAKCNPGTVRSITSGTTWKHLTRCSL